MANSKIRWNGTTDDGRTTTIVWGNNPYTWYDTDKQQWYLQHVGTGIREYI